MSMTADSGAEIRHALASRGAHALALLRALFPSAFRDPPVPLKVGIDRDILERTAGDFTADEIKAALRLWTRRRPYRRVIAAGGPRYGLDGSIAGEVTAGEQKAARAGLTRKPRAKPAINSAPFPSPAATPPEPPPVRIGTSGRRILTLKPRASTPAT
jgi:ProP effector